MPFTTTPNDRRLLLICGTIAFVALTAAGATIYLVTDARDRDDARERTRVLKETERQAKATFNGGVALQNLRTNFILRFNGSNNFKQAGEPEWIYFDDIGFKGYGVVQVIYSDSGWTDCDYEVSALPNGTITGVTITGRKKTK
ncbi:MAG TPA: hypothetical protein VGI75_08495 [Pirellulales bacterium]|jgi:hypothetical protein